MGEGRIGSLGLADPKFLYTGWINSKVLLYSTVNNIQFSSVQSLSRVRLFLTPWTAACQASLSHHQLPEFTQTHVHWVGDAIQPCHPLSSLLLPPSIFPSIRSFPMSQFFASGGQSIGVSGSTSVLPMNIQDWFPLGLTGWISLLSKGLSGVFSNTTVQKHQFLGTKFSL